MESYRPITRRLTDQPGGAALDVPLRALASPAGEPMRESWPEAARRYFQRFVFTSQAARPDDFATRCRPAA